MKYLKVLRYRQQYFHKICQEVLNEISNLCHSSFAVRVLSCDANAS